MQQYLASKCEDNPLICSFAPHTKSNARTFPASSDPAYHYSEGAVSAVVHHSLSIYSVLTMQLSAMIVFQQQDSIDKILEVSDQNQLVEAPLAAQGRAHGVKRKLLVPSPPARINRCDC